MTIIRRNLLNRPILGYRGENGLMTGLTIVHIYKDIGLLIDST